MKNIKYKAVGDGYECAEDFLFYSKRYNKFILVQEGFYSDGATWAPDIDSDCWWVHDVICRYGKWTDGTPVSNWQASSVVHDILKDEGQEIRSDLWRLATFIFGGGAARKNGMVKLHVKA